MNLSNYLSKTKNGLDQHRSIAPLPEVEKTPILLMRFTSNVTSEIIQTVIDALTQGGIIIIESEGECSVSGNSNNNLSKDSSAFIIGLTTTQKLLEHEAEIIRLVKPCRTRHKHIPTIMERFTSAARADFISYERQDFITLGSENYGDYDDIGLFTSAERALLVESMINAIPCPKSLDSEAKTKAGIKSYDKLASNSRMSAAYEAYHSYRKSSRSKDEFEEKTTTLIQVLNQEEYIDILSPLHIPHISKKILKDTYSLSKPPPLQAMRDYYGEQVAFYWAWMDFMTKWFAVPGLVGFIVYVLRTIRGDTIDTCDLTPFVGLFVFCWAVLCTRYWERREYELSYRWGTIAGESVIGKRNGFRGKMRRSPVTGQKERYYPKSKRIAKCILSGIITLILLVGVSVVMIISLNVQGYVTSADNKHWEDIWGYTKHPLYLPYFAKMADEGAIFDANCLWKCFLPVILRALIVNIINQQYSKLARALTEWENHETIAGHQNSLVLKRLLFEAFDAYIILFYLAFYERDALLLRLELVGAFNTDTLRRVFTECVLPWAMKKVTKKDDIVGIRKKDDDIINSPSSGYLSSEAELEEYQPFDDWIEMIIQFGYVTLFASAYPLAAFIAIFANMVEMRTDCWKLTHICRRKNPIRVQGIGMWKHSLVAMTWLSAVSNLYLFAFTSSQLRQWLPDYYHTDERGQSMPNRDAAYRILLVVLIIEHCVIIIAALVRSCIPHIGPGIRLEIEKYYWFHENNAADQRTKTVKRASQQINVLSTAVDTSPTKNGDT